MPEVLQKGNSPKTPVTKDEVKKAFSGDGLVRAAKLAGSAIFGGGAAGAAASDLESRPAKIDKATDDAVGYKRGGVVSKSGGFRTMTTTMKRGGKR